MKRVFALMAVAAFVVCCKTEEIEITGTWLQYIPGQTGWMHGIKLNPDGTARSVNMRTLVLDSWSREGDKLILTGKSVGNRLAIPFTDTLVIEKRSTSDSLYLRQGDNVQVFGKLR